MENLGKTLAKARNQRNLSVEELSEKTRIKKGFIRALEANDLENLPKRVFAHGFVQILAKELKLNSEELKSALDELYGDTNSTTSAAVPPPLQDHTKSDAPKLNLTEIIDKIFSKKNMIILTCIITFGVAGNFLFKFVKQVQEETKSRTLIAQKTEKKKEVKKETPTIQSDNNLKPAEDDLFDLQATKKHLSEVKEKEPEVVAKEEPKKEEVSEVDEKEEIIDTKDNSKDKKEVEFNPAPLELYSLKPDAEETQDTKLLPKRIRSAVVDGKQNVYINAFKDDTWISYKVDDQKIKRYILRKGRSVLLRGDKVLILMGNLFATKIFLNNELVVAKSRTGVKSLIFPESEAKNHEFPLFVTVDGRLYTTDEYKRMKGIN